MRRKITTALLLQIELTNRHQVRSGTVLLPNFPRLEASRVVHCAGTGVQHGVASAPSTVQHGAVFSTVKYVQHSPVCSELFSTMQLRRSDRQLRRPSPLHCCLTPGRRIFSFQLNRNQILRILASLTGKLSHRTIQFAFFCAGSLFILSYQVTFCKLSNLIPILQIR